MAKLLSAASFALAGAVIAALLIGHWAGAEPARSIGTALGLGLWAARSVGAR